MSSGRAVASVCLALLAVLTAACADLQPPLKELHQAQGALDGARAAGAEQYAADEYESALEALRRYDEAVDDHDYRLALSHALDAYDWAQEAARQAADRRATVRADAKQELRDVTDARDRLAGRLSAVPASRARTDDFVRVRGILDAADLALQEARSALDRHEDLAALTVLAGVSDRLFEADEALTAATGRPAATSR